MHMYEALLTAIQDEAARSSAREIARRAGLPLRAVQNVLDGHMPGLRRAEDICAALGLQLSLDPGAAPQTPTLSAPDGLISDWLERLACEYERSNAHGRLRLLQRLETHFAELA